jgi:hypothetical protein
LNDVGALRLVGRVLKAVRSIDEDVMTAAKEIDPLRTILVECRSNGKAETCDCQFEPPRYGREMLRRGAWWGSSKLEGRTTSPAGDNYY